jgi:hypothetical protein
MTSLSRLNVTWISGMPRSGTTWLSQIFASSPEVRLKFCPLFSYEFKNALDEKSSGDEWKQLFWDVYNTKSEFLDQDYLRKKGLVPTFEDKLDKPNHLVIKSTRFHNLLPRILERTDNVRFIHIVRHPCDCINSWLRNPHEFPNGADPLAEWRTGNCRKTGPGEFWGFDDWKVVNWQALNLRKRYPGRFMILRYEDIVGDTTSQIKQLFEELGLTYGEQTDRFIRLASSKHDDNKRSVFKKASIQSKWLSELPQSIINSCIDEVKGTELEQFIKI